MTHPEEFRGLIWPRNGLVVVLVLVVGACIGLALSLKHVGVVDDPPGGAPGAFVAWVGDEMPIMTCTVAEGQWIRDSVAVVETPFMVFSVRPGYSFCPISSRDATVRLARFTSGIYACAFSRRCLPVIAGAPGMTKS